MAQKALFKGMLAAALTLGVLVVSCESDQLTTDDVKAAVHEEIEGLTDTSEAETLESKLLEGLEAGGDKVTQNGNNYTVVTDYSANARLAFTTMGGSSSSASVSKSITVYGSSSSDTKNYLVELKFSNGDDGYSVSTNYSGTTYTTATTILDAEKKLVLSYQIFETGITKTRVKNGDITLIAKPTEAGIQKALAYMFESELQDVNNIESLWTEKPAESFNQTDAKYTFIIRGTSSSQTIYLPQYIATYTTPTTSPSPLTGYTFTAASVSNSYQASIYVTSSLVDGTVTIPFTLSGSPLVDKTIKGNLVITTKAAPTL